MAQKKYWIGTTGPYFYDDVGQYADAGSYRGFRTEGIIQCDTIPTADNHVVRFQDLTAVSGAAAPKNATYVVISLDATLTNERVFAVTGGLTYADGGAGANLTIGLPSPFTSGNVLSANGSAFVSVTPDAANLVTKDGVQTISGAKTFSDNLVVNTGKEFRLYDADNSNYVGFVAPALSANKIWTLPSADGSSGQALVTNGSAVLSFATITAAPGGSDTQVQFNDGGAFGGDAGLVYNKTTNVLTITSGALVTPKIYPAANSTTAVQILKADGTTSILNVDTTNSRVGILTSAPKTPFHIISSQDQVIASSRTGGKAFGLIQGTSGTAIVFDVDSSGFLLVMGDTNAAIIGGTSSGGTEFIRVTNVGRVGINQTNPQGLFHCSVSTTSSHGAVLQTTTNSPSFDLLQCRSSSGGAVCTMGYLPSTAFALKVKDAGGSANAMALVSGGSGSAFSFANAGFFAVQSEIESNFGGGNNYAEMIFGSTLNALFGNSTFLTADLGSQLGVVPSVASKVGFIIKGVLSQSADLLECLNSSSIILSRINALGYLGIGISPITPIHTALENSTTAVVDNVVTVGHNSTGTPAAGFGSGMLFTLESSTTPDQNAARFTAEWVVATHATRTARSKWSVFDYNAEREVLRIEADGSVGRFGAFGVTAVIRQTALTTALTTITHSGPTTPDYAIATPTVITPWGFTTQDEFETVMSVVRNSQIRINELETKLQAYGWLQ